MEHASSPPQGRLDGLGRTPPGGEAPRAERPDPWGRRQAPGDGPWTEQPGPWGSSRNARGATPRGWGRPRAAGGAPGAAQAWFSGRGEMLRRIGGFALLGCSLWLVAILAFFQAIVGLFS